MRCFAEFPYEIFNTDKHHHIHYLFLYMSVLSIYTKIHVVCIFFYFHTKFEVRECVFMNTTFINQKCIKYEFPQCSQSKKQPFSWNQSFLHSIVLELLHDKKNHHVFNYGYNGIRWEGSPLLYVKKCFNAMRKAFSQYMHLYIMRMKVVQTIDHAWIYLKRHALGPNNLEYVLFKIKILIKMLGILLKLIYLTYCGVWKLNNNLFNFFFIQQIIHLKVWKLGKLWASYYYHTL